MFHARALSSVDARVAYPLVACQYPSVTLRHWTDYVRLSEKREIAERLVCLVDSRDRHHAVFAYRVSAATKSVNRLLVAQIATFQLIGDAIHRALHGALEALASEHACREVVIEPWTSIGGEQKAICRNFPEATAGRVLTLDTSLGATGPLH